MGVILAQKMSLWRWARDPDGVACAKIAPKSLPIETSPW